jgi:hypothetical protein
MKPFEWNELKINKNWVWNRNDNKIYENFLLYNWKTFPILLRTDFRTHYEKLWHFLFTVLIWLMKLKDLTSNLITWVTVTQVLLLFVSHLKNDLTTNAYHLNY